MSKSDVKSRTLSSAARFPLPVLGSVPPVEPLRRTKWGPDIEDKKIQTLLPVGWRRSNDATSPTRKKSNELGSDYKSRKVSVATAKGFWLGVLGSTLLWWCAFATFFYTFGFGVGKTDELVGPIARTPNASLVLGNMPRSLMLSNASSVASIDTKNITEDVQPDQAKSQPTTRPSLTKSGKTANAVSRGNTGAMRSAYAMRFTDMTCYTHGDESELCTYENAMCFDGERLVLSVLKPPGPDVGSNHLGHIQRDLTTSCMDARFDEPTSAEFTGCRYSSPRFNRNKASVVNPNQLSAPPTFVNYSNLTKYQGLAFPADGLVEPLFMSRRVTSDWAVPLTRRRWGPTNRGQLQMREIRASELFGPWVRDAENVVPDRCLGCSPPKPPSLPKDMRVLSVSQFGNTTVTWLDGALWLLSVDQTIDNVFGLSSRALGLYSAQRHNSSEVGGVACLCVSLGVLGLKCHCRVLLLFTISCSIFLVY